MIANPDVAIVIPVDGVHGRNTLPDLRRVLAAVGDDPAAEILVIDDRADTLTSLWLVARTAADRRLRVLRGAPEGGAVRARNIGIDVARAPLVAFLDPAGVWRPGKLGVQRALHAGHPDLGFSFTDAALAGTDGGSALAGGPRFQARHGAHRTAFLLGGDALAQLFAENVVMV